MQNPNAQHPLVKRRGDIYLVTLILGLLVLVLTTHKYGAGAGLVWYIWAFPAGIVQCFTSVPSLGLALTVGYAAYFSVWLGVSVTKRPAAVGTLLTVHLLIVILTVSGCHGVVKGLPH
jgi:hypothetical protein